MPRKGPIVAGQKTPPGHVLITRPCKKMNDVQCAFHAAFILVLFNWLAINYSAVNYTNGPARVMFGVLMTARLIIQSTGRRLGRRKLRPTIKFNVFRNRKKIWLHPLEFLCQRFASLKHCAAVIHKRNNKNAVKKIFSQKNSASWFVVGINFLKTWFPQNFFIFQFTAHWLLIGRKLLVHDPQDN